VSPTDPRDADKSLGALVSDVSEKASLLVREEIELAKAEVAEKVKKLAGGAAIGAAAGVFVFFALVMFLHALAWFFYDLFDVPAWAAFAMVTLLLLLLALFAGLIAARLVKRGAPPTPDMAIEQAKITRDALDQQSTQRDQLERSLERTKQADEAAGKETG
jgi:apolipoprotein N-acyltransferase